MHTESLTEDIWICRVRKSLPSQCLHSRGKRWKYIKCASQNVQLEGQEHLSSGFRLWGHQFLPLLAEQPSQSQRWAKAQRGRGAWKPGAQWCEHKVNLNLQECPLQLGPKALGGQGNGKQRVIGFCYMETDLKSSMQREHSYVMKQKKKCIQGSGKGREGCRLCSSNLFFLLSGKLFLVSITASCSLRCVLALPKTARLTPLVTVFFLHPCNGLNGGSRKNTAIS